MKFAVVLLALVSAAVAAPQPRKVFHEHYDDFADFIQNEVWEEITAIAMQYAELPEWVATFEYLDTTNFKDLVYEMEALPEVIAVLDYLEAHSIDAYYFINLYNEGLELINNRRHKREVRQAISGQDFNSFTRDVIGVLPKEQLAAMFDQKIAEDEGFKAAIEGLESAEFQNLLDDMFENPTFQAEVQTLSDNGIDVWVIYDLVIAMFGQDVPVKH